MNEIKVANEELKKELKNAKEEGEAKRNQAKSFVEKMKKEMVELENKAKVLADEKGVLEIQISKLHNEIRRLEHAGKSTVATPTNRFDLLCLMFILKVLIVASLV